MRSRTIARLDLLAAEREARLVDAIGRYGGTLQQSAQQAEMLDAYRTRLAASWQDGALLPAGQASRASQFAVGAEGAKAQIARAAAQTQTQLQAAADALAELTSHRRKLAEKLRDTARVNEVAAEQKAERAQPWRRA
jgi:hypothetical protein